MNRNIASVKAHTPVLGKLARMRQMQGRATRLDRGLAAFSERVAQRVKQRDVGQWRRFSLEYLMDEEGKAGGAQAGSISQNIDLDVVFQLGAQAQSGIVRVQSERELERIATNAVLRMQPEWLLRRYDIHGAAMPVRAGEAGRVQESAQPAAVRLETRTLMERALQTERTVERRQVQWEAVKPFVSQRPGARGERISLPRETVRLTRMVAPTEGNGSEHGAQAAAAGRTPEVNRFARVQMRSSLPAAVLPRDAGARAEIAQRIEVSVSARPSAPTARLIGTAAAGVPRLGMPPAQRGETAENVRLVQQIRMRNRLGAETLVHAQAADGHESEGAGEEAKRAGTQSERIAAQRTAVLWRVLERTSENMLRSVERATVLPGTNGAAGRRGADGAQGQDALREVRLRSRFGYETLVYPDEDAAHAARAGELSDGLTVHEVQREWTAERVRAERSQVLRRVLERTSERMLSSVEKTTALPGASGANGADGRDGAVGTRVMRSRSRESDAVRMPNGMERAAGLPGRPGANGADGAQGRNALREVRLRSRFGYETLAYPGEDAADAARAGELSDGLTVHEVQREWTAERVRAERSQVLRRVLERTSERMLSSVEKTTTLPGASGANGADGRDGAVGTRVMRSRSRESDAVRMPNGMERAAGLPGRPGANGADGAQGRNALREVRLRSRFGYETLVYPDEDTAHAARAGELGNGRVEREVRRDSLVERVRMERSQVLRRVLERTSERMLRSVEKTTALPGVNGAEGQHGADGAQSGNALREVRLRSRFGYETLVYPDEDAAHAARAGELGNGQAVREVQRELTVERVRAERSQVLRRVLERTSERMLRSVEKATALPGAAGVNGADGRDGAAGTRVLPGRESDAVRMSNGMARAAGIPGRTGANGADGRNGTDGARGQDALREVRLRSQLGYETLIYPGEDAADAAYAGESGESRVEREVRQDSLVERVRAERSQVLRRVLERTNERMLRSVEKTTALPGAAGVNGADGRDGAAGTRVLPGRESGAVRMSNGMERMAGIPGRTGIDGADGRRGADGARGRDALREVRLRSQFGYETLIYSGEDAADAARAGEPGGGQTVREVRREGAAERSQVLRQALERTLRVVERREEQLQRTGRQRGIRPATQSLRTTARPLRTAVEGQAGMTMLMRRRDEAPRSTLEMIARAGEADSPLRPTILTQPAEIVMVVPPTTMNTYGADVPRVGNLTWDSMPGPEKRSGPEAALRLMQKAQQKFGAQARYRPPEMVMREKGDATGRLASQQQGQPANINQQMRASRTVVRESAPPELTGAEVTRIVDKVYDRLERKIAAEFRRRGR